MITQVNPHENPSIEAYRIVHNLQQKLDSFEDKKGKRTKHKQRMEYIRFCAEDQCDNILKALSGKSWDNKSVIDYYKEVKIRIGLITN